MMKRLSILGIALACSFHINAQMMKLYKNDKLIAKYSVREVDKVVFSEEEQINGHDYVEIGGKKWATMNLGATTVAGSYSTCVGDYYQWAAVETIYSNAVWEGETMTLTWKEQYPNGYVHTTPYSKLVDGSYKITKYTSEDGKTILDPEDDASTVTWEKPWRTPTTEDFRSLLFACGATGDYPSTVYLTQENANTKGIYYISATQDILPEYHGVEGILFVEDEEHKLFFPKTGHANMEVIRDAPLPDAFDLCLGYWSSQKHGIKSGYVDLLYSTRKDTGNLGCCISINTRNFAFPIRPVSD